MKLFYNSSAELLGNLVDKVCYEHNTLYVEADIPDASGNSASFDDCLQQCRDTTGCVSVSWRESDTWCWPKNKVKGDNVIQDETFTSAVIGCVDGELYLFIITCFTAIL